jgi:hypothetical protein
MPTSFLEFSGLFVAVSALSYLFMFMDSNLYPEEYHNKMSEIDDQLNGISLLFPKT